MNITISFEEEWLKDQRTKGVRVIRMLEKWVGSVEGCKLKTSSDHELVVDMEPEKRPGFVDGFEKFLKDRFSVSDPAKVVSYSDGTKSASAKRSSRADICPPADAAAPVKEAADADKSEAVDVGAVLKDLSARVPIKHSEALYAYLSETAAVVPMLKRMGAIESFWQVCPLIAIDSGYGLSDFLHQLAEMYVALGLVKSVEEKTIREMTVSANGEGNHLFDDWDKALETARDMHRANAKGATVRPILCLKVGAWQGRLNQAEVKRYLRRINAVAGDFTLIFAVPFVEPRVLNVTAEALGDIFNVKPMVVPPVPTEQLVEYAGGELAKRAFKLEETAAEALEQWVLSEKRDDSFFGYKTMEKLVNKMIYGKALANCRTGDTDRTITPADIAGFGVSDDSEGDPLADLSGLVGLGEVKRKVEEIISQIKAQRKMSGRGRKVKRPAIHMLFSGNPGTGKTTVARIVARLLKKEGVLRKGHLLEVHGRDLCGEYVGQTAPKTSAICRDAYGSVLFIDEAYSLFRGDGNDRDYGREALDTLIAEMENHRDDMCVILAGYTDDMQTMLAGNEGLRSRIPFTVDFPDYSRAELVEIFFSMVKGNFDYEKPLEAAVKGYFDSIPDETLREKGFSNARFVRNLYERTWGKAAYRSRLSDGEIKLLVSDLAGATEEREFKQLVTKSARRTIGFGAWAD